METPPLCEYRYHDGFEVTEQMLNDFKEQGYIIIRNLLDQEELQKVIKTVDGSDAITKHAYNHGIDEKGRKFDRVLWSHPGHDVTGMVARSEKVAGTCEKLLGGEVYHYHSKLMMKPAKNGGTKPWHQDYGYWYFNGCLYPDMMTVFIPIDPCKKENGCLQILVGSHKCGRVEHKPDGREINADMKRVNDIKKICPLIYVEMDPGDAVLFHSNILHASDGNMSDTRRWAFLCVYNRATNNPTIEHHHPRYTPLYKVPNSAIKECTNYTDMTGKDIMSPKSLDNTISNINVH